MSHYDKPLHPDADLNDAWWAARSIIICDYNQPTLHVHHNGIRDGSGRFNGYLVHYQHQDLRTVRTCAEADAAIAYFRDMDPEQRAKLEATKARWDARNRAEGIY